MNELGWAIVAAFLGYVIGWINGYLTRMWKEDEPIAEEPDYHHRT